MWIDRLGAKGLNRVSNAKLLSLHDKLKGAQEKFKSREALVDEILGMMKRSQDAGLRSALNAYPLPRLLDFTAACRKKPERR